MVGCNQWLHLYYKTTKSSTNNITLNVIFFPSFKIVFYKKVKTELKIWKIRHVDDLQVPTNFNNQFLMKIILKYLHFIVSSLWIFFLSREGITGIHTQTIHKVIIHMQKSRTHKTGYRGKWHLVTFLLPRNFSGES